VNVGLLLIVGAALALLAAIGLRIWVGDTGARRGTALAALGLALMLASVGAGVLLLRERQRPVPEQRGVGVLTSVHPRPSRGLVLSAGVRFHSCKNPVDVTMIASGTSEFWADQARSLRRGGTVQLAVPDLSVRHVRVALGVEGKSAPIAPLTQQTQSTPAIRPMPVRRLRTVTVIGADVPGWGRHLRPVVFRFDADWLQGRSLLGSCFVRLPALVGFPTVLSAQEIRGQAVNDVSKLHGTRSFFVVSSRETGLQAYYDPELETTRGVTSIQTGSSILRTDLSQPAPDGNVQGAPSWTCTSTPPQTFGFLETLRPGERPPDVLEGSAIDSTGALSNSRLGAAVGERTCASYAVIEQPAASVIRDLVLLFIGAAFSIGVGFLVEAVRERGRRREP
jgi:hypothetical protein